MLSKKWIAPFKVNNITFLGAYVLSADDSDYAFLITRRGYSIVLHNILVSQIVSHTINDEFAVKLLSHGMISIEGIEHWNNFEYKCDKIKPQYFLIDLTKSCNYNCIYCFRNLNENRKIKSSLLSEICDYINKTVFEFKLDSITIQFWGGEPLLASELIQQVLDYFRGKKYKVRYDIETNASLITPKIAQMLYNNAVSVGVSVDGTPKLQNLQRPQLNGESSSASVEKGCHTLSEFYGTNFGGICVVTKHNFRYVYEIISYFISKLGIHNMKFNLVRDNPNADTVGLGLVKEDIKWFAQQLCDITEAYNIIGVGFSEGNIRTRRENLFQRLNSSCCISCGCTGGKRIISFDMDGNIFPCELTDHPQMCIGSIYSNKSLGELLNNYARTNRFYKTRKKEECDTCPWHFFCRGGCSSKVYYCNTPDNVDENECILNQTIYPYIVKKLLCKGGGSK